MNAPIATVKLPQSRRFLRLILFCGVILFVAGIVLGPITPSVHHPIGSISMQQARCIALALNAYAHDHHQLYPNGRSSTEVFQKLLDEGYVSDPYFFYLPLPGKTRPATGEKLKPYNVAFDVTSGADSGSSDGLPLVFMTGYKVNYVPDGEAIRRNASRPRTWAEYWDRSSKPPDTLSQGLVVAYKNDWTRFILDEPSAILKGMISHFLPPDFNANGRTYRQLTPDGSLP